jgi:peptide/nickel transport system ATP-binding protein
VIRVLTDVRAARPSLALLLITHDLILAERLADRVAVLYGGVLVEDRTTTAFFQAPRHPYARGLLDAGALRGLRPIPGAAPTPGMDLSGCVFAPRCDKMIPICRTVAPSTKEDPTGRVLCHSPEGGE